MTDNSEFDLDRRDLLLLTGGSALLGGVGLGSVPAPVSASNEEVVFQEDFEQEAVGEVPTGFVLAGNTDQEVVDDYSATGQQSYRMSGSHGGCWRAIMRKELFDGDPRPESMRFSGHFRLDDGEVGCHDNASGRIGWRTVDSSSWSSGSGAGVLQFRPNGDITSAGKKVGEYERYEWVKFEAEYYWDKDEGEVTHVCKINDGDEVTVTRDERDYEEDLTALALRSDDFTVFWDNLVIEVADEFVEPGEGTVTGEVTDSSAEPIADAEVVFVNSDTDETEETVTTNENGTYDAQLPAGTTYNVVAQKKNFGSVLKTVTVSEDMTETINFTLENNFEEFAEAKLEKANEVDEVAVYLSETSDVETLLNEFRDDLQAGEFADESLPAEAVRRHTNGELVTERLIQKTAKTDEGFHEEQIAVRTTSFNINVGVSLVMMKLSIVDLINKTSYGRLLPDSEFILDNIDAAIDEIISIGFSQAKQSEAMLSIVNTAQEAYNNIMDGQFDNADEFESFLENSISATVSNLTLQRTIETGDGISPLSDGMSFVAIDKFANAEGGLNYLQENIDSESVQKEGLSGDLQGAQNARSEANDQMDFVASTTDTFLTELENRLDFIGIISNVYDVATGISEGDLRIWEAAGFLSTILLKAGLTVSTVRAIGAYIGEVSIRVMMTLHARGIVGVERGDPIGVDDINALVPDVDSVLGRIDPVDDRWGDIV